MRRQSAGKSVIVSPRDLLIFRLLARYRYLPSNFLHAFVGGNPIRFKQRLGELFHEGYLGRPYRQWQAMNARYRPAVYELDDKARAELMEADIPGRYRVGAGGSFAHELIVCIITASLELAARDISDLNFVTWEELAMTAPASVRLSPTPSTVPVSIRHHDRRHEFNLKPDGRPFALRHASTAGPTRILYFPGIEVDRHTEPLSAFDLERSSILRKVLGYREMVATEAYKSRLGFTNMLVPIVTVNPQHMHNMIDLVLQLTNGKGASYLLFKTVPDFVSLEKTLAPDDRLLREPWQRAGYSPFDIAKELLPRRW